MPDITKVRIVTDEEVAGEAGELFAMFRDKHGKVPEWARVMANRPEILVAFYELFRNTMGPGLVEQDNKWKVAYRVSKLNKCEYCLGVARDMMLSLGVPEEHIDEVAGEVTELKPEEQAAVRYAEAVTLDATAVPEEVMQELKSSYDDAQIVEITSAIGLFNSINRFNDALGVVPS